VHQTKQGWLKFSNRFSWLKFSSLNLNRAYLGPVWYSSQQLHELFFCQTLISKTASWVKLFFFSSHKDMSWDEAKKNSLLQLSPPHFSLSSMHKVVGEAILPNIFFPK
jgi:hypothetical protein